jgi:hypothetical protein
MNSSSHTRRSFTLTTLVAGALALGALGLLGVVASDYLRIQDNRARARDQLEEAKASLERVTYDGNGDVVSADRSRYQTAMYRMKSHTDQLRNANEQVANLYPYTGAGMLGLLVFTIVAVRSTRRVRPT